jgi:hypothetical protein
MSAVTHCGGHDRVSPRFEFRINIMTPIDFCVIRSRHRSHPGMRASRNDGQPREHVSGRRGPCPRSQTHDLASFGSVGRRTPGKNQSRRSSGSAIPFRTKERRVGSLEDCGSLACGLGRRVHPRYQEPRPRPFEPRFFVRPQQPQARTFGQIPRRSWRLDPIHLTWAHNHMVPGSNPGGAHSPTMVHQRARAHGPSSGPSTAGILGWGFRLPQLPSSSNPVQGQNTPQQ